MKHLIPRTSKYKLIFFFLIIAAVSFLAFKYTKKDDRLSIDLKPLKIQSRWGYEITVDHKTFIRQEYVPAVDGQLSFSSKDQALMVGRHAVEKLKAGTMPIITKDELKMWGVIKP